MKYLLIFCISIQTLLIALALQLRGKGYQNDCGNNQFYPDKTRYPHLHCESDYVAFSLGKGNALKYVNNGVFIPSKKKEILDAVAGSKLKAEEKANITKWINNLRDLYLSPSPSPPPPPSPPRSPTVSELAELTDSHKDKGKGKADDNKGKKGKKK